MKCPHCSEELMFVERSGRKCAKCKREFALEPRENQFELSDLRLRGLAERLSQSGSVFYTPSQLYWQAGRKKLESRASGSILLAIGLIVVGMYGLLSGAAPVIGLLLLLPGIMPIANTLLKGLRGTGWIRTVPPMSPTQFSAEVLARWQRVYGAPPQGMIEGRRMLEMRKRPVQLGEVKAIVVGPADVVDCLRANGAAERFGVALLPSEKADLTAAETELRRDLVGRSDIALLVLHDASVEGCGLPARLRTELGLRPEHRVVDLGLRPRTVRDRLLVKLNAEGRPSRAAVAELKALAAVGKTALTAWEINWLAQGHTSPVAALAPKQLMQGVERAMRRLRAAEARRAEQTAERNAKAVGFLTWPGATVAGGTHEVSAL